MDSFSILVPSHCVAKISDLAATSMLRKEACDPAEDFWLPESWMGAFSILLSISLLIVRLSGAPAQNSRSLND